MTTSIRIALRILGGLMLLSAVGIAYLEAMLSTPFHVVLIITGVAGVALLTEGVNTKADRLVAAGIVVAVVLWSFLV